MQYYKTLTRRVKPRRGSRIKLFKRASKEFTTYNSLVLCLAHTE